MADFRLHEICPKMTEFFMTFCPKNIFPIFWEERGVEVDALLVPVSYAYAMNSIRFVQNQWSI